MLFQSQCVLIVLANVKFSWLYGDQSVILWGSPVERLGISVAETEMSLTSVLRNLQSLKFVPAASNSEFIMHYCTRGVSAEDYEKLRRDNRAFKKYQAAIKYYKIWLTSKENDKIQYYSFFANRRAYKECIDHFQNKEVDFISPSIVCNNGRLLEGIATEKIGIKGPNNCFAPYKNEPFHISAMRGFPLEFSRNFARYTKLIHSVVFVPLVGEVHRLIYDRGSDIYYLDDDNEHNKILKGSLSYEIVLRYINPRHATRTVLNGLSLIRVGCKKNKP